MAVLRGTSTSDLPLPLLIGALSLVGACQEPQSLEVRPGCDTPEVVECLQKYAFQKMHPSDIRHLLMAGRSKCFSEDPDLDQGYVKGGVAQNLHRLAGTGAGSRESGCHCSGNLEGCFVRQWS